MLETLQVGQPLIVVINELLMDNHQLELASQLAEDGHLYYATCRSVKYDYVITITSSGGHHIT